MRLKRKEISGLRLANWRVCEINALCNTTNSDCLIEGRIAPQIFGQPIAFDSNQPLHAVGFPADAAHFVGCAIFVILLVRCRAKVVPTIVLAILVAMVHLIRRVLTSHVEEGQAVRVPLGLSDFDEAIAIGSDVPGYFTRLNARKADPPSENASCWIVVKKFAQTLRGKIGLSHETVLSLSGQRLATIRSRLRASSFSQVVA